MIVTKLTASQLDRALSRANKTVSTIMDELIAQGRGYEKISAIRSKMDELSKPACCGRTRHIK